jgi:hypothetical protein
VGPRIDLGDVKTKFLTLQGHELKPLCRAVRSQSLCRLRKKIAEFCTNQMQHKSTPVVKTKLRGLSPRANYTDITTAACRRS